jgi:hypothetical protein
MRQNGSDEVNEMEMNTRGEADKVWMNGGRNREYTIKSPSHPSHQNHHLGPHQHHVWREQGCLD